MTEPKTAPYGSWKSPVTSDLIVADMVMLGQTALDGENVHWTEVRPIEGGRYVIVRRAPDGRTTDITPPPFNARTQVHEYGGGAYLIADGTVYFSNWDDQRLYRQDPGESPRPITPDVAWRYADAVLDRRHDRLICVREDHTDPEHEATNALVSVDLEGDGKVRVLVSGNDFYAAPRLSPDGSRLAWLTWNHPNMPWNGTELWVGEIEADGSVVRAQLVTGGENESIFQPEWSPDGVLTFVSDRTGWWNLYRWRDGRVEPLVEMEAEFGAPQWVFGMSLYAYESAERIICAYTQHGDWHLASLDVASRKLTPIETPYSDIAQLRASPGRVLFLGGSPTEPESVVQLDLATGQFEMLRRSSATVIEPGYLSIPQTIEFPTENGLTSHAFFYPPTNRDYVAPDGERPPLIVISHGGPTGATSSRLTLTVQYWTSRGFAVLDVNYGGSAGYGRSYRQRLEGQWGVVDVDDCVNGARYLVERSEVVIEVPAWTCVKRTPEGAVDFVSPLPSPFNYGSVLGTRSPDGDPLDALVLGPRLARGARVRTEAFAEVDFLDGGLADPKRICGRPLGWADRLRVVSFFRVYALAKRALYRARGERRGPTRYRGIRSL